MTAFLCLVGIGWTGALLWGLAQALLLQFGCGQFASALASAALALLLLGYQALFVRRLYLYLRSPHRAALRASWRDARSRLLHRARYVMWSDRRPGRRR